MKKPVLPKKDGNQLAGEPARFESVHAVYAKGQPPSRHEGGADVEITSCTEGKVTMDVMFDHLDGGYRQNIELYLDASGAREIAYQLLLFANDLE